LTLVIERPWEVNRDAIKLRSQLKEAYELQRRYRYRR